MREPRQDKQAKGKELEKRFADELRDYIAHGGDHCSCRVTCDYHGDCLICVAIHRGHGEHYPACFIGIDGEEKPKK